MKTRIEGLAYVLGDDIDTDQIIPAHHLVYSLSDPEERKQYGRFALSGVPDHRCDGPFVPEGWRSPYAIIVAGDNFGCGSSREHAPWALYDYGFRAVISTEIADIFTSNALKNGLLPIVVSQAVWDDLASQPDQPVTIDLQANEIRRGNAHPVPFGVESFARQCLLGGVDTLGWLQSNLPEIEAFERSRETV